jgi:hypothetical protein
MGLYATVFIFLPNKLISEADPFHPIAIPDDFLGAS